MISGARRYIQRRMAGLLEERQPFDTLYNELSEYILLVRQKNAKGKSGVQTTRVMDATATQTVRIFASSLLAGMASPSRPWFSLSARRLGEASEAVREWLETFRDKILDVFEKTNFYTALGTLLKHEGVFGTAAMLGLEDREKVLRYYVLAPGSFAIAQRADGRVDTIFREYVMSVKQVVDEFGLDNCSARVREAYKRGREQLDEVVCVIHAIMPASKELADMGIRYMDRPFVDVYVEGYGASSASSQTTWGGADSEDSADGSKILRLGGYYEFPAVVARWEKNDEDVYASSCPGMIALPDVKQLQRQERAVINAMEKMVNPPLKGGPGVRKNVVSLLAGSLTIDDDMSASEGVRPIHEVNFPLQHAEVKQEQIRQRVRAAFYEDLLLMLARDARSTPPTAEEIRARDRERFTVLGPIQERHSDDVFSPLIERASAVLIRASLPYWQAGQDGPLPMPPEELQEEDIQIEYVSQIAQALKSAGIDEIERFMMFVGNVGTVFPQALDLPDVDEIVRKYADSTGLPVGAVRDQDEVDANRQFRADMQMAQQAATVAPALAKAGKDMSETAVGDSSALEALADA